MQIFNYNFVYFFGGDKVKTYFRCDQLGHY